MSSVLPTFTQAWPRLHTADAAAHSTRPMINIQFGVFLNMYFGVQKKEKNAVMCKMEEHLRGVQQTSMRDTNARECTK